MNLGIHIYYKTLSNKTIFFRLPPTKAKKIQTSRLQKYLNLIKFTDEIEISIWNFQLCLCKVQKWDENFDVGSICYGNSLRDFYCWNKQFQWFFLIRSECFMALIFLNVYQSVEKYTTTESQGLYRKYQGWFNTDNSRNRKKEKYQVKRIF